MRAAIALLLAGFAAAQEPELPVGLDEAQEEPQEEVTEEPELPLGLGGEEPGLPAGLGEQEPELPSGLGDDSSETPSLESDDDDEPLIPTPTGFLEARSGVRTQSDPHERRASISEARLHLDFERMYESAVLRLAADLLADGLARTWRPDLETGEGSLDLREANVSLSPHPSMDLKVGRQVLTWGTGDLVFINDMFPKDWVSFFVGRDDEYLKAPSDAVKLGLFSDAANLEVAYTPRFDPDRFITGERLSYYDPALGRTAGRDAIQDPLVPDDWFSDDELALRVSRNVGRYELAAYGYWGRWKSPAGMDPDTGRGTFPRLNTYGASARTQMGGGIANVEVGYYDSRQDPDGDDPLVDNSQIRTLIGFERDLPELTHDLTLGVQYYVEALLDHDDYQRTKPAEIPERDELRHLITTRVTKQFLEQRLRVSLFGYFSPSDDDVYVRTSANYAIDDSWSVMCGVNLFAGDDEHTFFGQFEDNTNVWFGLRFGF